jgi:hypothetical protein
MSQLGLSYGCRLKDAEGSGECRGSQRNKASSVERNNKQLTSRENSFRCDGSRACYGLNRHKEGTPVSPLRLHSRYRWDEAPSGHHS